MDRRLLAVDALFACRRGVSDSYVEVESKRICWAIEFVSMVYLFEMIDFSISSWVGIICVYAFLVSIPSIVSCLSCQNYAVFAVMAHILPFFMVV